MARSRRAVAAGRPGRRVLVTGGGTGIGLAIATAFAEDGATVAVAQRNVDDAKRACRRLRARGLTALPFGADLVTARGCQELMRAAVNELGGLDVLVNNAAVTGSRAIWAIADTDDDTLDRIIDVNLKAPFRLVRDALPHLSRGSVVLNIGSVGAFAAQEHAVAYSASKAGLEMLTKALALELAPAEVRVVGIAPGDVLTGRSKTNDAAWERAKVRHSRETPLPARGRPGDIAAAALFLASPGARFVTGTTLIVDGGLLAY